MSDATCKTCPFWAASTENPESWGWCHHVAASENGATPAPAWWCSEHPLRQRDRLAAMAMQGLAARDRLEMAVPSPWLIAERAYEIADAMLGDPATFPVVAEDPTGRTVEVRDPTTADAPDPFTGWNEPTATREEWQAFYFLCAAHARLMANAEEVRALMAEQDPERRDESGDTFRENARTWREAAERYARLGRRHA